MPAPGITAVGETMQEYDHRSILGTGFQDVQVYTIGHYEPLSYVRHNTPLIFQDSNIDGH
jgi:hypothetical protein